MRKGFSFGTHVRHKRVRTRYLTGAVTGLKRLHESGIRFPTFLWGKGTEIQRDVSLEVISLYRPKRDRFVRRVPSLHRVY